MVLEGVVYVLVASKVLVGFDKVVAAMVTPAFAGITWLFFNLPSPDTNERTATKAIANFIYKLENSYLN